MTRSGESLERFEFATATRIVFGAGSLREIGPLAASMGRHALVVTGRGAGRAAPLLAALESKQVGATIFSLPGEPTTDMVSLGLERAAAARCDMVIGFGGGSALDAGKAVAALLTNGGDPLDYLEVVGHGKSLRQASAPYIAIPTTAGSGAEVTRNAVLIAPKHGVKASLRSVWLLPRLALVDPELTQGLPPALTASTGLDALTQLIEPYVSVRANPLVDALCREGMSRVARSLRRAYADGHDGQARQDMALASLFGGLALANAGLGAVHGFAAPIGGMFPAPHGAVCAALLPYVMELNLRALRERQPASPALGRYVEVAQILTGRPSVTGDDGVAWVRALCEELRIPGLRSYQIATAHVAGLCEKASAASSMKANPVTLSPDEMREIVERAL